MGIYAKLLSLLSQSERRAFYLLMPLMIMSGTLDIIGIAFVVPFMAVVVSPESVQQHQKLAWLYSSLHFTSVNHFLVFLGLFALGALIVGNAFNAFVSWSTFRFANKQRYALNCRLMQQYLYQPYMFFLNRHSADLSKTLLNEIDIVVNAVLTPAMQNLAKIFGVLLILLLLIIANPGLSVLVAVVLGGAFAGVFVFFRQQYARLDRERYVDHRRLARLAHEGFGGIKELKLSGKEENLLEQYKEPAARFASNDTVAQTIGQLPRYALEIIAFGGVLLMVVYLLLMKQTASHIIPLLALFAFACYRLMPALQTIFANLGLIRTNTTTLLALHKDLMETQRIVLSKEQTVLALPFTENIALKNIYFTYPGANSPTIKDLSLNIKAKTTIGIVGSTGAGKTTLVDIILGLLHSQQGLFEVDGVEINNSNRHAWQKNLGYVPQQIFLSDESIARNIAFGVPAAEINYAMVEKAAKIANLHEFISMELPEGYDTLIGERGVRLSGGQRQRIGVARALYHDPEVLVLDEATSALDSLTESAIMDAINNLAHKKTIIIIAHRLTTVEKSDVIYLLEKGKVSAQGTYAELISSSAKFQQMAKVNVKNENERNHAS